MKNENNENKVPTENSTLKVKSDIKIKEEDPMSTDSNENKINDEKIYQAAIKELGIESFQEIYDKFIEIDDIHFDFFKSGKSWDRLAEFARNVKNVVTSAKAGDFKKAVKHLIAAKKCAIKCIKEKDVEFLKTSSFSQSWETIASNIALFISALSVIALPVAIYVAQDNYKKNGALLFWKKDEAQYETADMAEKALHQLHQLEYEKIYLKKYPYSIEKTPAPLTERSSTEKKSENVKPEEKEIYKIDTQTECEKKIKDLKKAIKDKPKTPVNLRTVGSDDTTYNAIKKFLGKQGEDEIILITSGVAHTPFTSTQDEEKSSTSLLSSIQDILQKKPLKKPIVMIANSCPIKTAKGHQKTIRHWVATLILPATYSILGKTIKNENQTVLCIDSFGKIEHSRYFKEVLMSGGEDRFECEGKEYKIALDAIVNKNVRFVQNPVKQQKGGTDCAWWAVYNALMTLLTGNIDYIDKDTPPEYATGLRNYFPEIAEGEENTLSLGQGGGAQEKQLTDPKIETTLMDSIKDTIFNPSRQQRAQDCLEAIRKQIESLKKTEVTCKDIEGGRLELSWKKNTIILSPSTGFYEDELDRLIDMRIDKLEDKKELKSNLYNICNAIVLKDSILDSLRQDIINLPYSFILQMKFQAQLEAAVKELIKKDKSVNEKSENKAPSFDKTPEVLKEESKKPGITIQKKKSIENIKRLSF